MSVLRSLESKLESLFEGVFGRAFRSNVQPVELARKLVKEMDDHRSVSVSRVYVPNEYTVYLSPGDRDQFDGYEDSLCEELADYLTEHARRERYVLLTTPRVKLETDDDLDVGEFGIATRLVRGPRPAADAPPTEPEGGTMIYKAEQLPPSSRRTSEEPQEIAVLTFAGETPLAAGAPGRDRPLEGLRHPPRRPERLAAPRRGPAGRRRVQGRRPRLDQRDRGRRKAREGARAPRTAPGSRSGSTEISFSRAAD